MTLANQVPGRDLPSNFSMLEIGVGSYPFSPEATVVVTDWGEPNLNFDFTGDRKYLAVDNGTAVADHSFLGTDEQIAAKAERKLASYKEDVRRYRPGQNVDFRFQDALALAKSPDRFNEVFMSDVLSSMIGGEGARALLQLSADVLVEGGLLVTRETFTPQFMDADEITGHVKTVGFSELDIVSHSLRPDEYDALRDYYGETLFDAEIAPPRPGRYFCLARK